MFSTRRLRVAADLAVSALVAVVAVSTGTSANSQSAKIVIWADSDRIPAVTQVANAWAIEGRDRRGRPEADRGHPLAGPRRSPRTRRPTSSWARTTGSASSVPTARCSRCTIRRDEAVPAYALKLILVRHRHQEALRHARRARERRADHEHATRQGADVVRGPRAQALAAKRTRRRRSELAVQQGSGGDAFHMYPFFSGLGGYIFGRTRPATSTRPTSASRMRGS